MAIKIIEEPDVHLTGDELARFTADYQRDYMFYSGTPPTFESYCRGRKSADGKYQEQ
jgi:hypothetical protein